MDTACQGRLIQLHPGHGVHEKQGQFIGSIPAMTAYAADTHIDKRHISGKVRSRGSRRIPDDFGALDHKTADELECFLTGQPACFYVLLVERVHVLVYTAKGCTALVPFQHE